MLLMVANTVVLGLSAELFFFGVALSFWHFMLINEHTAPLLVFGIIAMVNFPVVVRLREFGVANLNFELHENALNSLMTPPETWSNVILTLLDQTAARSQELIMLVRLIEEAPGPVERQDRRAEAKAWLMENRAHLTDEDRDFVRENLGYLFRVPENARPAGVR